MKQSAELLVNEEKKQVDVGTAAILLDTLREELGLTGAKPGCKNGDCGACTVIVNKKPVKSCLLLTMEAVGKEIITIEGLKNTSIQKAFVDTFAFQCGYCTPGFIMNCYALLQTNPQPSEYEIKNWLQSNICRCTGYEEIQQAIHSVIPLKNAE